MMNKKEFGQLMAAVQSVFEIKAKDEAGYMVWFEALEDLEYHTAAQAVKKLTQTKKGFLSPSEIREAYVAITAGDQPSLEQTLNDMNTIASKFGRYRMVEGMDWLQNQNPVAYRVMKAITYTAYANNQQAYMHPTIKQLHKEIVTNDSDVALLQSKFASEIGSIKAKALAERRGD